MTTSYRRFDAAEFFETEEDFAILLEDAVESGDPRVMSNALAIIARSQDASSETKDRESDDVASGPTP